MWRRGGRPAAGLAVEIRMRSSLYSRMTIAAALTVGVLAGLQVADSAIDRQVVEMVAGIASVLEPLAFGLL